MQFTGGHLWELENAHSNVAIENRTLVDTNFRITKTYEIIIYSYGS